MQIHVSNCKSKFEFNWPITADFVVLPYEFKRSFFFWSRKWSMMPTRNCFPNRKRCHQIRCFVICWTSACVRLQRTTNRWGKWRGQVYRRRIIILYKKSLGKKTLNQIIIKKSLWWQTLIILKSEAFKCHVLVSESEYYTVYTCTYKSPPIHIARHYIYKFNFVLCFFSSVHHDSIQSPG